MGGLVGRWVAKQGDGWLSREMVAWLNRERVAREMGG
jgi:hypothetical protein